jgi:hypothetical protein
MKPRSIMEAGSAMLETAADTVTLFAVRLEVLPMVIVGMLALFTSNPASTSLFTSGASEQALNKNRQTPVNERI